MRSGRRHSLIQCRICGIVSGQVARVKPRPRFSSRCVAPFLSLLHVRLDRKERHDQDRFMWPIGRFYFEPSRLAGGDVPKIDPIVDRRVGLEAKGAVSHGERPRVGREYSGVGVEAAPGYEPPLSSHRVPQRKSSEVSDMSCQSLLIRRQMREQGFRAKACNRPVLKSKSPQAALSFDCAQSFPLGVNVSASDGMMTSGSDASPRSSLANKRRRCLSDCSPSGVSSAANHAPSGETAKPRHAPWEVRKTALARAANKPCRRPPSNLPPRRRAPPSSAAPRSSRLGGA